MGRIKEKKIVVTYHTTTDAMTMEEWCKHLGIPGRIIPVPPSIFAGCGLAWCANVEEEENLKKVMEEYHISYQDIQQCEI